MQPRLKNRSYGSRIFLCLHAGQGVGQNDVEDPKIERRYAKVVWRQALFRRKGIWGPRNVGSGTLGGII